MWTNKTLTNTYYIILLFYFKYVDFETVLGKKLYLKYLSYLLLYNKPPHSLVPESTTIVYSGHKYQFGQGSTETIISAPHGASWQS